MSCALFLYSRACIWWWWYSSRVVFGSSSRKFLLGASCRLRDAGDVEGDAPSVSHGLQEPGTDDRSMSIPTFPDPDPPLLAPLLTPRPIFCGSNTNISTSAALTPYTDRAWSIAFLVNVGVTVFAVSENELGGCGRRSLGTGFRRAGLAWGGFADLWRWK